MPMTEIAIRSVEQNIAVGVTIKDRHSSKTPNLKSEKPFGFRNGITIND
jgi:hypothetical protein